MLRAVYTTAIFLSAFLLFFVQPMFAKLVLPLLGGTPAVWNTCAVFFQFALLVGYVYAHLSTQALGVRRQAVAHLVVLAVGGVFLPIGIPREWTPPTDANPIASLLWLLATTVGPPFLVVSTTGPLLQKWFSETGDRAAGDPYFLFAASNLGSLLALAGYPFVAEPLLRTSQQTRWWSNAYWVLLAAIAACAALLLRTKRSGDPLSDPTREGQPPLDDRVDGWRRLRWTLLAFVPSSLTIGATTYITSDIASIPLFWVVPLAIYLLSFILAFARRQLWPRALSLWLWPPVVVVLTGLDSWYNDRSWLSIVLHLANLFLASMVCHGELAADRPKTGRLTEYYLLMSVGGNLGGIFNAIVAPLVFSTIVEYPLMLALACALRPMSKASDSAAKRWGDWLWPALLFAAAAAYARHSPKLPEVGEVTTAELLQRAALFAVPALICFLFVRRPLRFALGIAAALAIRPIKDASDNRLLHVERSFFGVHKVDIEQSGRFKRLLHGTTIHGTQQVDPANACRHTTYYHPTGPIGQLMSICATPERAPRVAIIGLGAGGLGAYRKPGQDFTFFEIDPAVKRIAENPKYFTYLSDCCANAGKPGGYEIVLGDGRLKIAAMPDGCFGLIAMDAFGSDAVPMHLLTREAVDIYVRKLAPGGVLVFNLSTRILELPPVVARIARDAGLQAFVRLELIVEPLPGDSPAVVSAKEAAIADGKVGTIVVAVVREPKDLGPLASSGEWINITYQFPEPGWTDDFSNLLEVIHWR